MASGKSCSLVLSPNASVRELKAEAQKLLRRRFLRLALQGQLLDISSSLLEVGVRDGDSIDAVVQPVKLSSSDKAFAFHTLGGAALAWGAPSKRRGLQPGARAVGTRPANPSD